MDEGSSGGDLSLKGAAVVSAAAALRRARGRKRDPADSREHERRKLPSWPDRAAIERINTEVAANLEELKGLRPTRSARASVLGWYIAVPETEKETP